MKSIRYERRRLKLLAEEVRGSRVLDVGYAKLPNPWLDRFNTVGLDLEEPSEIPGAYTRLLRGDATRLDEVVGDEVFDSVVAGEFIEHLEDPYDFLRRVRRILTSDGRVVLSTPNPLGFPVLLAELIRSRSLFFSENHTYYFLPRWMEHLLERCGYRVLKVRPVGFWLPFGYLPLPWAVPSYQLIYVARVA